MPPVGQFTWFVQQLRLFYFQTLSALARVYAQQTGLFVINAIDSLYSSRRHYFFHFRLEKQGHEAD